MPNQDRNTPTCVGKTPRYVCVAVLREKHPHVRGEDRSQKHSDHYPQETPPRAWGRPRPTLQRPTGSRNTPTCVGKTTGQEPRTTEYLKHPHVRGEDSEGNRRIQPKRETPPRAWGRRDEIAVICLAGRNTPTCVGKTYEREGLVLPFKETPPRAWGRQSLDKDLCSMLRNTPTCVGKTSIPLEKSAMKKKHPHVRGEDKTQNLLRLFFLETPPRAWGRPNHSDSLR